jgi:hypothetical protein
MNMKVIICLFLLVSSLPSIAAAQNIKAILVQLNTEQSKIGYFRKAGRNGDAEKVIKESAEMNKRMISDFTDHFTLCPVYYYVDTNADRIKNKNFDNILLDAKGMPVAAPIGIDSDYLIALYGTDDGTANVTVTKGLVVYTPQYKQVLFLRRNDMDGKGKNYAYSSDFGIEYYPHATMLERRMKRQAFDN